MPQLWQMKTAYKQNSGKSYCGNLGGGAQEKENKTRQGKREKRREKRNYRSLKYTCKISMHANICLFVTLLFYTDTYAYSKSSGCIRLQMQCCTQANVLNSVT